MKSIKKLFLVFVFVLISFMFFACGEPEYTIKWIVEGDVVETDVLKEGEIPTYDGEVPTKAETGAYKFNFKGWTPEIEAAVSDKEYVAEFTQISKALPSDCGFPNLITTYDGKEHVAQMVNLPEGATCEYTDNKRTEPGLQEAKAVLTYNGKTYNYTAVINIGKCESVLTAEAEQTVESGALPLFELNNEEQVLAYSPIYQLGTYHVEIYAEASTHYKESNHVSVKITVVDKKPLGISFTSTTLYVDGTEQELLATNVPEGYTVVYKDNKLTLPGKTYAECEVYDSDGKLVEKLKAIFTLDYPDNEEFNDFLDEYVVWALGDNNYYWNVFFEDGTVVGYNRGDWGEPVYDSYVATTEENRAEAEQVFKELLAELMEFENKELSQKQIKEFGNIKKYVDSQIAYYAEDGNYTERLQNMNYVDQFGGACADFASIIEGYTYRNENDIKDILSYIKSVETVYPTYATYCQDRIDAGYPLSDYTLSEMIDYLEDIVEKGDEYYLIGFAQRKIDQVNFLNDKQKEEYKNQVAEYFKEYFLPANQALASKLVECKGHIEYFSAEGYWTKYENGKDLYTSKLTELIGDPNLSIDEYLSYIDMKLSTYSSKVDEIVKEYRALGQTQQGIWYNYINGKSLIGITEPTEMVDYLKEFALTLVPDLETDINVLIKYMDETVASKTNTAAYYRKSAVDNITDEYITLNPIYVNSNANESISTMAHEGYPGHLYAYVFNKSTGYHYITQIEGSVAYGEGWARYVQLKLYDYMKDTIVASSSNKKVIDLAIDYLYYSRLLSSLLYNRIDDMIHLEGKGIEDVRQFMDDNGFNGSAAEDMYRTLIEMPTGYTPYGYGMIFMNDLHIDCQNALGDLYNEVDFNKFILSSSQASLYELKALTEEYIKDVKFLYGE